MFDVQTIISASAFERELYPPNGGLTIAVPAIGTMAAGRLVLIAVFANTTPRAMPTVAADRSRTPRERNSHASIAAAIAKPETGPFRASIVHVGRREGGLKQYEFNAVPLFRLD